jgi:hypothetical protein
MCYVVYQNRAFHLQRDGNSFLAIVETMARSRDEASIMAYVYGYCPKELIDQYQYQVEVNYINSQQEML